MSERPRNGRRQKPGNACVTVRQPGRRLATALPRRLCPEFLRPEFVRPAREFLSGNPDHDRELVENKT